MHSEGCMDENGSASLFSGGQSSLSLLSASRWAVAESKVAELLHHIQPSRISDERRVAVAEFMKELIKRHFGYEVFSFGSVPLKTYLSDGDIDLTAFGPYIDRALANHLCTVLQMEEKNIEAQFKVKEVQLINAEVEVVKCLVEDIIVDISFNQLGGLCTLCFLEEVDQKIGQNHLFKRSIILVKAWCYYESRILGAHCSLISTYALETMVLYVFHLFYSSLRGPLEVLFHFLEFFSNFDWDHYGLSLWGPIPLRTLQENAFTVSHGKIQEPLGKFLYHCSIEYAAYLEGLDTQGKTFSPKFLNIVDPLRKDNNLGRSVNKGNLCRIRSAFSLGAKQLEKILTGPEEQLGEKLKTFFQSTQKHGSKHRSDVPIHSNDKKDVLEVELIVNNGRVTELPLSDNRRKLLHGQSNANEAGGESSDLRAECGIDSSECNRDASCIYGRRFLSEDANGLSAKGHPLHKDVLYRDKDGNELLTPLMDGDTLQVNVLDTVPKPSQQNAQEREDINQVDQHLSAQFVSSRACNVVTNASVATSLETRTLLLNHASSTTADQIPDTPSFSQLDGDQIATKCEVFDICKVGCNQPLTQFQYHSENQPNCEMMHFGATFLSQKAVHIPPGFSSSLTDLDEPHSTGDNNSTSPLASKTCLSICNSMKDEKVLLKSQMRSNLSKKMKQQVNAQEREPEENQLNDYREKDAVTNSIEMHEEQFLSDSETSCISRNSIDNLHSREAKTLKCHSQLRDNLPDNSETKISTAANEKPSSLLDQSEPSPSNGSYEAPDHVSEVMQLSASGSPEHSDNFETLKYYYCLPASWLHFKAPYLPFPISPVCNIAPQRTSEMRSSCENPEISLTTVAASPLQDDAISEIETDDLQGDILKGDLKTYQYHLQVGHFMKSPYGLRFTSPVSGMPMYNGGQYFWEGPGRPVARNIPNALNHGRRYYPGARPLGINSQNAFGLRNGYFADEASRSRKGTGSYFPNLRQNYAGRHPAGSTKGQWDYRSHEAVHADAIRSNRHDINNHEGTHVFVPNYSHSAHGRLHSKANHRLERNNGDAKAREKRWEMPQGQRFQNNSSYSTSRSNCSSPLYMSGGIDVNLCFSKKTNLEHDIPSTCSAIVNSDSYSTAFAAEKLELTSLGFEPRPTREGIGKGNLVIGCTEGTCSRQQIARHGEQVAERSPKQKSSSEISYEMKEEDFPPLSCGRNERASNFRAERNAARQASNNETMPVGPTL